MICVVIVFGCVSLLRLLVVFATFVVFVRCVFEPHPRPSDRDQHGCTVGVLAGTHPCAAESRVAQQQSANSARVAVLVLWSCGKTFAHVVVWTRCKYINTFLWPIH